MKYTQIWTGYRIHEGIREPGFPASVPGTIQYDYAKANNYPDVMYSDNYKKFEELENDFWEYRAHLTYLRNKGESIWFVSDGIDYQYDILLNEVKLYSHEGLYTPVELELTPLLRGDDELCVRIYPHPKREGAAPGRQQADHSCKPPVCYGWDWNPRLLVSGMWQEAWIESRSSAYLGRCEVRYTLKEDFSAAEVTVLIEKNTDCTITLTDADGNLIYRGKERSFTVDHPRLWWCNGQGEPYLYSWSIESADDVRSGNVGFRRIRLLRNIGAVDPKTFPKTRYDAPFTLELNSRRIFMQGSNWVNPELFWGRATKDRYEELIRYARDAHMNIFRMWGGSGPCKGSFYDLCDQYGILCWQEFMLACNCYPDEEHYLNVLETEASSIIRSLRSHACLAFWGGGNELFNGWSGMTDQSLPLRLLNKLCYESDREHPFLPTSPLTGMAHGCYLFRREDMGGDVFQSFENSYFTAYTEFGIPSIASMDILKQIIPENELFPMESTDSWIAHHALKAWDSESWACTGILKKYFGDPHSTGEMIEHSQWLQSVGYQVSFEEMRRQWPHCSAAINWCYDEPWMTAANNSLLSYPAIPKPGYYAVQSALRPVLFSARIPKFDWKGGEIFRAGIWLLNNTNETVSGDVRVSLKLGDEKLLLLEWNNANAASASNTEGAQVCCTLPEINVKEMRLCLEASDGRASEYRLLYSPSKTEIKGVTLNM